MTGTVIAICIATMVSVLLFSLTVIITMNEVFRKFEEKYTEAGKADLDALYLTMEPNQLMVLSIACGGFFGFMGYLLGDIMVCLVCLFGGLFVPLMVIRKMKARRQYKFNEQLIDCLGNISNSLRSGFTIPQSVEMIGREMDNPLAMEFRITHAEMRLGLPPVEAMQNMTKRMPINDLDLVVTAMSISEGLGGNLSNIFENISHTIRERFRVEGRIQSLSAMGRMQGQVLVAMPFVLVLFMTNMQPEFIAPLFDTLIGRFAIAGGLIWLFLGWLSIRAIVDIDV